MRAILLVLAALWTFAVPASGQPVVVTLDNAPATMCNEAWTEAGVELTLVNTTSEDCDGGGNCFFGVDPGGVSLFPSRLNLDLTTLSGSVTSAEVDVQDFCGIGCTRAFLYQGATLLDSASNTGGGAQTLILDGGGAAADRLAVSSCEGMATEVRLDVASSTPVPGLGPAGLALLATALLAAGVALVTRPGRPPVSPT